MLTALFLLIFLGLIFYRIPIALSMLISSVFYLLVSGDIALEIVIQRMVAGANSFSLLAVPLFIFAGELMAKAGLTERITNFARAAVGHITGGLGHVAILANALMGAISGSAIAGSASTGMLLIPGMVNAGYTRAYSAALISSSAILAPIIPPSITMIVYGVATSTPVGKLFIAGIVPGIAIALALMVVNFIYSKKQGIPKEKRLSFREFMKALKESIVALLMPVFVLGGIWGGVVTPTEAAGLAVLYSFIVWTVSNKKVNIKDLAKLCLTTLNTTAKIMFIICAASLFGWLLTYQNVASDFGKILFGITTNKIILLILINIILLVLGLFMETVAVVLMAVPVLMPIITQIGVDPVHFGVLMTVNLMIGCLTPPLGVVMFVVNEIADITVSEYVKTVYPFWIALTFMLFLLTFYPQITLWLPNLLR